LEIGKLSIREFLREVNSLKLPTASIGEQVEPKKTKGAEGGPKATLRRTGNVVRILAIEGDAGNTIEGTVKPGALTLTQMFTTGKWDQEIVKGKAVIKIDNSQQTLAAGAKIKIKPKQKFKFENKGDKAWQFTARHSTWMPDKFFYQFGNLQVPGTEMWFELKTSSDDDTKRPMYNVRAADETGTFVVTLVEPGTETLTAFYKDGDNIITGLSGEGTVVLDGKSQGLARGASVTVKKNQRFKLRTTSNASLLAEIRPTKPRMWNPMTSFYETSKGNFVTGDLVWFEYILPS
jgi:mannose-6-phosphate isomerase-like protein (cupin superfamily)